MLVDCDIHVGYETVLDLAPHLDPATRELVVNCGTNGLGMPSYPWYHPTGWLRNDAFDRASTAVGAQLVGQTLERVRANVLDPLGLAYGVLTPDEAAAFSILPNGIPRPFVPQLTTSSRVAGSRWGARSRTVS